MTAIMLLFGMVVIAFFGTDIIMNGIVRRRAEGSSIKAFYAAEGASEKVFLALKVDKNNTVANCKAANITPPYNFDFNNNACDTAAHVEQMEGNNALPTYYSTVNFLNPNDVEVVSHGSLGGTTRQLYVKFCLPSCAVDFCGSDGCQGVCLCGPGKTCNEPNKQCYTP